MLNQQLEQFHSTNHGKERPMFDQDATIAANGGELVASWQRRQRQARLWLPLALLLVLTLHFAAAQSAYANTFTVNSDADSNDSAPGDGFCFDAFSVCTLRAAVEEANALPGADTIILPAETYILNSALSINSHITINGSGAATTIISQSNGQANVIFVGTNGTLIVDSITIEEGSHGILNSGSQSGNTITVRKSAIRNSRRDGIASQVQTTIIQSTISNNGFDAGFVIGGGVTLSNGAELDIYNSTISGNGGAGVRVLGSGFDAKNVTISGNGTGIRLSSAPSPIIHNIQNTIITNNAGADCEVNSSGPVTGSNNLIDDHATGPCSGIATAAVDGFDTVLRDNGGGTQTHAIFNGSDARSSGNNAVCNDSDINNVDQRNITRHGNACDIGAYEYQTFSVNSTQDTGDAAPSNGVCADSSGNCTLRAAIEEANALGGTDVINLPSGTYNVGSVLNVTSNIVLLGALAHPVIHGTNSAADVFFVNGGSLTAGNIMIENGSHGIWVNTASSSATVIDSTISQYQWQRHFQPWSYRDPQECNLERWGSWDPDGSICRFSHL